MRITGIRVSNFKSLQDFSMQDIPGFAVLVGANGTGKSTFIDVFDFLKDCLQDNVRTALQRRGGFSQVISRGRDAETIVIELRIAMSIEAFERDRTVTYRIEIEERDRRVAVRRETLRFTRARAGGRPYPFIDFKDGKGEALAESLDADNTETPAHEVEREFQELDGPHILALKGLGQFRRFDAASQLRELIENWTVTDIHIDDARREPDAAVAEHLSESGDNIALYAQYLYEEHREAFDALIEKMSRYVPGVANVYPEDTGDGRVALRFEDHAFKQGFIARAVSDGTIKMFAYLALLHDPDPHPLLCVEEPENQLYPSLLTYLAEQFAEYARRRKDEAQVFVTTHSPDFLNAVPLESIYWLIKRDGFSTVHRAAADEQLRALNDEGDRPGWMWQDGLFEGVHPA